MGFKKVNWEKKNVWKKEKMDLPSPKGLLGVGVGLVGLAIGLSAINSVNN
jgi:hypothetical protein